MNSRRVKNSISALERDITNYESFLSKVISGKVDKPKSSAYKPGQSGPRSVRGRSVTPPASASSEIKSRSRKNNTQPLKTADHVLCKEVFKNNNATVEVRVTNKAPTVGKSRKRPRASVLITAPETDRSVAKDEIQKQSNVLFQPPDPSNFKRDVQHERKSHLNSNHKQLPWALVLKDKNIPCVIHNARPKDGEDVKQGKLCHNPRRPTHRFKRSHKHLVPEDSLSSSISDDTSDDRDYVSRSVQCCLPETIIPDDKENDLPPSKLSSKYNTSDGGGRNFSMFNPMNTLNFLVKELRGKLQKSENDDNVQRIITSMEDAVRRISSEINREELNQTSDVPTRDETATTKPYEIGFVPVKSANASHTKPVVIPGMKYMEPSLFRQFEHRFPPLHGQYTKQADLQSFKPIEPAKEITSDTQTEQTQLELKCTGLELECDQLKKERDSLNVKMSSAKEEIEGMAKKENDYLTAISCLRTSLENVMKKAEEQASTVAQMAARNAQLEQENKALLPLRDAEAVLARPLEDHSKEKENTQLHLQIMKLEREKFDILLARKDKEVEKLKQELRNIQAFASEQLMNLKSYCTTHIAVNQRNRGKQSPFNKECKLHSLATEISLLPEKAEGREIEKQPVCSSPTSSVPSSRGVYPSWQMISRISSSSLKDVNKLSSKEVPELSLAERNNIKDIQYSSEIEGNKSFPFTELKSPEFKSFLVTSLSENVTSESRSESIEPKTCKELKDKLRDLFEKIKEQARRGTGILLPSPPHQYSEISEPGGMSQWSEVSDVESVQNSHCFSSSSTELNKGKFDFSTSDLSFEIKFGELDS